MLTPDQRAAVERFFYDIEEDAEKLDAIATMQPEQLEAVLQEYNWDDGFAVPTAIADHPQCDRALALRLFDLSEALWWYTGDRKSVDTDWLAFCEMVTQRLLSEGYPIGSLSYTPDLTRVQLYKFRKAGVPEILLSPVEGLAAGTPER